jgi:hypothetical protein
MEPTYTSQLPSSPEMYRLGNLNDEGFEESDLEATVIMPLMQREPTRHALLDARSKSN